MSDETNDQPSENIMKFLGELMAHCRHIEIERSQFMQVYIGVVTALISAAVLSILNIDKFSGIIAIHYQALVVSGLLLILTVITFIGLSLTIRWTYSFEYYRDKINTILSLINFHSNNKPDLMSITVPPIKGVLSTKHLFPLVYSVILVIAFFADILLFFSLYDAIERDYFWWWGIIGFIMIIVLILGIFGIWAYVKGRGIIQVLDHKQYQNHRDLPP
jgi:hypothetical protein